MTPNEALRQAKAALDKALEIRRNNDALIANLGPAMMQMFAPFFSDLKAQLMRGMKLDVQPNVTVTPQINIPPIQVPEAKVTVTMPEIKIPEPKVTVNVPPIKVPDIMMPDQMEIRGWIGLMGYDKGLLSNPLPVQIRDARGNPVDFSNMGGGAVAVGQGGGVHIVKISGFGDSAFGNILTPDGRLRVATDSSASAGLTDAELRAAHLDVQQVSGSTDSVNIVSSVTLDVRQVSGSINSVFITGAAASVYAEIMNPDGRVKVELPTGSTGLTDAELRASRLDVIQVSGSNWSVSVTDIFGSTAANIVNPDGRLKVELPTGSSGLTDAELRASRLDVIQVSGSNWSVSVSDIFGSTAANVINPDGRIKVELPSGASGLTDTELRASAVPVAQVSGASWSVAVSGYSSSVFATPATPDGVPYNSDNPQPVTIPSTLRIDQLSGAVFSVNNVGPVGQGDEASALRVVHAGNSALSASASIVSPIAQGDEATAIRVVQAGNSISSVSVTNTVTITGALSSSASVLTRQTNPAAVAADFVPLAADDLGRQLVRPIQVRDLIKTAYATATNGTETTLLAGTASAFNDLIYLMGANNSDAAVSVDIRCCTGGPVVTTLQIPAYGTVGFTLPVPIPQYEVACAWTFDGPDETGRTIAITALFSQEV